MPRTKLAAHFNPAVRATGDVQAMNKRIKAQIAASDFGSGEEVAKAIGISPSSFYQKIQNKAPWKMIEIFRLSYILDCEVIDLVAKR